MPPQSPAPAPLPANPPAPRPAPTLSPARPMSVPPPPAMPPRGPSLPPSAPMRHGISTSLLAMLGVVLIAVIGAWYFGLHFTNRLGTSAPAAPQLFALHDTGTEWYALSGSQLTKVAPPTPTAAQAIALAKAADGGVAVQSLAEGKSGVVALVWTDAAAIAAAAKAKGPILAGLTAHPNWPYMLTLLDTRAQPAEVRYKVPAYGPAWSLAGKIVALAPEGISSYDAFTGEKKLVIPATEVNPAAVALSEGATYAAVPNTLSGALDLFAISLDAGTASYIGSIAGTPAAAAFVGADQLIVKGSDGALKLYALSASGASSPHTLTLAP